MKLDSRQRLLVELALLDWLIQEVNPSDANRLLAINHLLKQPLRPDRVSKVLRGRLGRARVSSARRTKQAVRQPSSSALVSTARGQAYTALCRQNGVPIPPDWGTPQWVKQGDLGNVFISANLNAEVFAFRSASPEGVVVALPRYVPDTDNGPATDRIALLGIISLGKQSGKVCFWDNQTGDPMNPQFSPRRDEVVPFERFGGGMDLNPGLGACTDCHAGENPYVIHPDTVLESCG